MKMTKRLRCKNRNWLLRLLSVLLCLVAASADAQNFFQKGNTTQKVKNSSFSKSAGRLTKDNLASFQFVKPAHHASMQKIQKTDISNMATITFDASGSSATGVAPADVEVEIGSQFTIPVNRTLYKEGFTLTGWTDGTNTYATGETITVPTAEIVTLMPVFTANEVALADRTQPVTVEWNFRRDAGAPSVQWQNQDGLVWVAQAIVNGKVIDVALPFSTKSGKFSNTSWTEWCQLNEGTTFHVPSCKGATISMEAYSNITTTSIDGQTDYTSGQTISYIITSSAESVDVVIGDGGYYRYIKTVYPVPATEEVPDPVTIPEGLVVEDYTLRAWHYRYNDEWKKISKGQYINNDEVINIKVGFDGKDVYIQGFFDRYIPNAWIKGTMNEDETAITFKTQYYGTYNEQDRYFFGWTEGNIDSDDRFLAGDVVFQYDKATSTLILPSTMEIADSNNGDTWWSSDYYVYIVITKGYQEQENLVVPPEGIHLEDYSFSASVVTYDNNNDIVETPTTYGVKVGFDGDDVYIKGVCQQVPEAWVKGSIANGKLTIPANQYMGSAENSEVFLTGFSVNATNWMDLEDIILDYESDEKLFSGSTEQFLVVNASKVRIYYFTEFLNVTIARLAEQSVKPEFPRLVEFGNYENNSGYLRFNMPVTDIYGNALLEDKLYYQILVDDDHSISGYTFIPAKYETIESDMTLVPYTFIDNKYFDVLFNYETRVTDKIVFIQDEEPFTKNRIGLRSVYYGGGIENASDTTWYSLRKFSDEYKFKIQEGVSYQFGEEVTSVEGIKMTFGQTLPEGQERTGQYADFTAGRSDNKVDGFDAYTVGNGANPKDNNIEGYLPDLGNLPTNGTFYTFEPEYNGALTMGIVLNVGKPFYILEDGVPIPEFRAVYISPDYGSKYYGLVALNVQGGKKYHVFATGSKLGLYGFIYQPGETTDTIGPEGTRELLFNSLVYTLPDEDLLYDGEAHTATVEDGVGRGTLHIIYKDSDGNETEAAPVNPGTYTVSFDFEEGPVFSAIRFDNVGTFSIYQADLQEWEKLASAYQSMNQGEGWGRHWDFSNGVIGAKNLYGVTFTKGHVTEIDLSNNNITGAFPVSLLTLPQLVSLNLSNNQLTGNAGEAVDAYMKAQMDAVTAVKTINIFNNQLEGNIGLFASYCPELESLIVDYNMFDEVFPVISSRVTNLSIGSQTINRVISLHLKDLNAEYLAEQIPSIFLYNHVAQNFNPYIEFGFSAENDFYVWYILQNGRYYVESVSSQNAYKEESSATIPFKMYSLNRGNARSSAMLVKLEFDEGDANFNGNVDVLDLQTTINYMFEEYATKPFNFTAANLWLDDIINVQDVVGLVNLLFATTPSESNSISKRSQTAAEDLAEAFVFCRDGKLMINTAQNVAAFDIILADCQNIAIANELKQMGIICESRPVAGGLRLMGYSLSGATIPAGETVIGHTTASSVVQCVLANIEANEIPSAVNNDQTTGVITIVSFDDLQFDNCYDLQGRKVVKPTKGLYIVDGKKVFVNEKQTTK